LFIIFIIYILLELHWILTEILNGLKIGEQTVEDQYIIRKAKARYVYWEDKNNKVILIFFFVLFRDHI